MRIFYTIGIWFYAAAVRIAACFGHSAARLMVAGWNDWRQYVIPAGTKVAWFHAASLGEFEQARPVLEAFRTTHPEYKILLSFFSPSGYEIRKNYSGADAVCYLPPDTRRNARAFVDAMHPDVAFFVKYDFWFNSLDRLRQRSVPTYIFSAIFRPRQYFFRPWGYWFRKQLSSCFTHLFVQNDESLQLLKNNGISHCSLAGDTRYDRVSQIAASSGTDLVVEQWLQYARSGKTLVCGSTWPPDEELLSNIVAGANVRLIIAPHVISDDHLDAIVHRFPKAVRYSMLKHDMNIPLGDSNVLIIDNIGMLSMLYRYADVAYIGGGFGVGIHNILEAVAYGKPVLFGPKYDKFQEAKDIIALGGGWSCRTAAEVCAVLNRLFSDGLAAAEVACRDLMQRNVGSTQLILDKVASLSREQS